MAEPKFVPKSGQVDYTNIRYAPVVDVIVAHKGKILLVQRSPDMRLYPNYWHCISGFLDDQKSIEEKAREELAEELSLNTSSIVSLERGQVVLSEAPEYNKTWLAVPVLAKVSNTAYKLDWEAARAKWFTPAQAKKLQLIPGVLPILEQLFPEK